MDKIPNLEYGGYAFTNNVYSPLYAKMEKVILSKQDYALRKKIFLNMTEAEHCRLSLDGENVWEDFPK